MNTPHLKAATTGRRSFESRGRRRPSRREHPGAGSRGRLAALATASLLALFVAVPGASAAQVTWYVNGSAGSDSPSCGAATGAGACKTITYAISLASNGDTVSVAAGTYDEHLSIAKDLTIAGAGSGSTTIDAGGAGGRVVTITGSTVTLDGLKITGGADPANGLAGAGVATTGSVGSVVTIRNSEVTGNTASTFGTNLGAAGGVFIGNGGSLTVVGSSISENVAASAQTGGGIQVSGGATLSVTNSTISNNTAGDGAGIDLASGALDATITGSTISGNIATSYGGGIATDATYNFGSLTITNSTISANEAGSGDGGAIWLTATAVAVIHGSTISGNSATNGGGILAGNGTNVTVSNSTFSGNSASNNGGGICNCGQFAAGTLTLLNSTISGNDAIGAGGLDASGTETVKNTLIVGNTGDGAPDDVEGAIETSTANIIGIPSGKTLADILDPAGLAANGGPTKTIALTPGSANPAIGTADLATCAGSPVSGKDQRGFVRGSSACDVGAYEATLAPSPTPTPAASMGSAGSPPTLPPTETVASADRSRDAGMELLVVGLIALVAATVLLATRRSPSR